jgi:hypothetical protein
VEAPEEDVAAASLALVGDEGADVGAALDAADEMDEELVVAEEVTALCAVGAALEPELEDGAALETDADVSTVLDDAADEAWDTEATVCNVVAEIEAEFAPAAALFGNDPSPQRHEQAQEPSGLVVPVPLAIAPGDPTAGAAAKKVVSQMIWVIACRRPTSWTRRYHRRR